MYGSGIGEGLVTFIVFACIASVCVIWGGWELIDWLFIDDVIKSSTPITPEIELVVKDNVIDTIYVYRAPK
jgi:uncharacterized membrane protein